MARRMVLLALLLLGRRGGANRTATWLDKRRNLIHDVYGDGPGVLPRRSKPDYILHYDSDPGVQGLVWNISHGFFDINSTVFYSPKTMGKRSKDAVMFHHGHSNCICPTEKGEPVLKAAKCRPGCNSSMPTLAEIGDEGYSWWDLYNVSKFFHALGHDVFILSMPLKGVNLGPGSNDTFLCTNHWWFLQWEEKGDNPLRYFLEPAVLTANYAEQAGYESLYMAGLSGGGWSTTFAAAIDPRIKASFPIAGSVPCAMRNPAGYFPGQNWTGDDDEDYEQSCRSPSANSGKGDLQPGRSAFQACNYTCQYLLAGLEKNRFQVQILHEYDTCCFSPHNRHAQMKSYESAIRAELAADDRQISGHGWFTTTSVNHSKHEVCAQGKTIMRESMAGAFDPGSPRWNSLPCDIIHSPLPANCAPNIDPGLPPGYVPLCPDGPHGQKVPCRGPGMVGPPLPSTSTSYGIRIVDDLLEI